MKKRFTKIGEIFQNFQKPILTSEEWEAAEEWVEFRSLALFSQKLNQGKVEK